MKHTYIFHAGFRPGPAHYHYIELISFRSSVSLTLFRLGVPFQEERDLAGKVVHPCGKCLLKFPRLELKVHYLETHYQVRDGKRMRKNALMIFYVITYFNKILQ